MQQRFYLQLHKSNSSLGYVRDFFHWANILKNAGNTEPGGIQREVAHEERHA
jgi:hypothetical protein